jgi:hypothetical protein
VLRWIHKGWKAFWTVILSLFLIVIVMVGGVLAILQLDATKDIIAEKIENDFRKNYNGRLAIGKLEGLLPFSAELSDVTLTTAPDSATADTLLRIKNAQVGIDVWGLFQNKLSIDAFALEEPSVRLLADGSGSYTLARTLKKKKDPQPEQLSTDDVTSSWIKNIEIIAPQLSISNGAFFIEKFYGTSKNVTLPEPLQVDDVNARMFVELTESQRFVEMEEFNAKARDLKAGNITVSGQVYNDGELLEFNAFHITAETSHLHLNGIIEGVDVYRGALRKQLADAQYDIGISSHQFKLSEFTDVVRSIPDIKEPLDFTVETQGEINNLDLSTFRMGVGESYFSIDGHVDDLFDNNRLAYRFNIDTVEVRKKDVEIFTGSLNEKQYRALQNLRLNGSARGSADSLLVDVSGSSSLGAFELNGQTELAEPYRYRGSVVGRGVDIGPLVAAGIDTTNLNFSAAVAGRNTSLTAGELEFEGSAQNSVINHLRIDSLRLNSSLEQGMLEADYFYRNGEQSVTGKGSADFNQKDPAITLAGNTRKLNLAALFVDMPVDSTSLNTDYEVEMKGTDPDRMHGMFRFEVEPSVISGDSVGAHQINGDLDSPDLASRTLVVNSSLFDMRITGDLKPSNISNQATYWSNYFKARISEEIRLDSTALPPAKRAPLVEPMQVNGELEAKNLTLVRRYWPEFPSLVTNSTLDFKVTADSSDLQFTTNVRSDTLRINTVQVKGAGSTISGHFNHGRSLKEQGSLKFETVAERIETDFIEMDSVSIDLDYRQDSLYYAQEVKQFSKDARFNLKIRSSLSDGKVKLAVDEFFLGNDRYAWQNEGTPRLTYNRAKEFIFDSFQFRNQNEFFALKGTLSPEQSDSLQYTIRDVSLDRISDLIKGDINFAGRLNGKLQTRSLSRTPSVQGDLTINRLRLQDRLVGDLSFESSFNKEENRFDTRLEVITDSTKYQKYVKRNDGVGQNIVLDGYFVPADLNAEKDTVFYFDADLPEIDMWAVQLVTQNIFQQLEGRASGKGTLSGNLNDINFQADFQLDNVYARPQFLNTDYYLDGHVGLSSEKGVLLDNIAIKDDRGGRGRLSGTVDLNDFKPITYLDLRMQLNDLKFLDNGYDPDVPFFGNIAGTGNLRLSGSNTDMKLQSQTDIRVSRNSTLSIPLLEETELTTTNNFIQFVNSFDNARQKNVDLNGNGLQGSDLDENALEKALDDLSFSERFNLDLQFEVPDPINVRLIFDPVTGERMRAQGTGRLRISMDEGNVQMFGQYDVSGGNYNFVSGEIFSRELDIRPGGSILWEGPPDNARLDIEAVYHARPDPGPISNTGSSSDNSVQRVPVDLIVEISGTLISVQNDYYFQVPQSFDITSGSTLQYSLNQINNDEQQKLLQATSILLTGNFLQTGQGANQSGQLRSDLTKGSTFINPLLSNQVISPLLSNQINSLLNSDVSQFDIDFQLNQYNQIDLGIALRLYNDKLILRRDGYLTGGNSEGSFGERIGDLNATYRINPNLSITAFHRQDQTLRTTAGNNTSGSDLTQPVDGLGLEAQVQFNTWQQLSHKVQNFFRRLVGKNEIDFENQAEAAGKENEESITENQN